MVRAGAFAQNHGFAGGGGRAAHAVNLFAVWVGRADDAHEEFIPRFSCNLR